MHGAQIKVPYFKVLINLVGFPTELWHEEEAKKAVSSFGTYLGTIPPENPTDFSQWTTVIATEDLTQVPLNVKVLCGGVEKTVPLSVVTWSHAPVYKVADMPQHPPTYTAPTRVSSDDSSDDEHFMDEDEMISVSRRVIQEICRGVALEALPWQFRELMAAGKEAAEEGLRNSTKTDATENPKTAVATIQNRGRQADSSATSEGQGGRGSGDPGSDTARNDTRRQPKIAIGVLRDFVNSKQPATHYTQEQGHHQSNPQPELRPRGTVNHKVTNQRPPKEKEKASPSGSKGINLNARLSSCASNPV